MLLQKLFCHWENWQRVAAGTPKHFWLMTLPVSPSLYQTQASRTMSHNSITGLSLPEKRPLCTTGVSDPAYTSCWHCWYMARSIKSTKGRNAQEVGRECHSRVVQLWDFPAVFPAGLHSAQCRILHYLLDLSYSLKFITHQYLWYNLYQGHIHESCTDDSRSSRFTKLKALQLKTEW